VEYECNPKTIALGLQIHFLTTWDLTISGSQLLVVTSCSRIIYIYISWISSWQSKTTIWKSLGSFGFSPDSLVHVYYVQLTGSRRFYHAEYMSVERCDRNVRKTYAIRTGRGTWVENVVARLTAWNIHDTVICKCDAH
jgi:hypothetical protein